MYQVNDTGMIRERQQALLAEAEEARLIRRLKEARPKREESYSGKMRRRVALLISMVGLVMVLLAGAAYALDVECPPSVGSAVCLGTDANDVMVGTGGIDSIVGLGGDDVIHGLASPDRLTGDGNAATVPGDDQLFGGDGSDELVGGAGSDLLSGDRGSDGISADFLVGDGIDTVEGGGGDDTVNAVEGQKDAIDCGPGRDRVQFDAGLDSVKRCEIKEAF